MARSPARPVVDALAAAGHRYERAHPQSVVCMPSRSTMITGQHPSTHGVWMNGVALPAGRAVGGRGAARRPATARRSIGKPHFEPFLDPFARFPENRFARDGMPAPHRGFEHFEAATHGAVGPLHYARWLAAEHPEAVGMFYPVLDGALEVNALGGGDTGAPQVHDNAIAAGVVPHRLGGRSDDRLARLARRRRRLVLLDELPRSPPPVGSAGIRARPRRLARRAAARRLHHRRATSASRSSTTSRATGGRGTTAVSSPTTRRPTTGCRRR